MYQGHVTDQDVGNSKWLENLARHALLDQQFMTTTEGTVLHSGATMGITRSAKGDGKCVQLRGVHDNYRSQDTPLQQRFLT
jgi:hypothetical protein